MSNINQDHVGNSNQGYCKESSKRIYTSSRERISNFAARLALHTAQSLYRASRVSSYPGLLFFTHISIQKSNARRHLILGTNNIVLHHHDVNYRLPYL